MRHLVQIKPFGFTASIILLLSALFFCLAFTTQPAFADEGQLAAGSTETPSEASADNASASAEQPKKAKYTTVAQVKLNKKKGTIKNNRKLKLKATLVPVDPSLPIKKKNQKITWSVSKPEVARVSEDGVVQGKRSGTVRVTATAANGVKASAKIKVKVDKTKMAKRIPVLTYHRICSDKAKSRVYNDTNLAISESLFTRQMQWLKSNGYRTVSSAEFADWNIEGAFLPKKSVMITIDDGFYETYHVAYPILRRYNLKATSFVIGSHVSKTTDDYNPTVWWDRYVGRDVIREVRKEYPNLEFQSHTYNMHHRNGEYGVAKSWSRKSIDEDFEKNAKFGFTAIAYPFGHTSKNLIASVSANPDIRIGFGYMMDYPASRSSFRYNIPRFKVFGDGGLDGFKSIVRTAE